MVAPGRIAGGAAAPSSKASAMEDQQTLEKKFQANLEEKENTLLELQRFDAEYDELIEVLEDLPKKLRHEVMVPFGPGAFFPGEIRHTGEVMMHLGDNWFAERTVANALKTVRERKAEVVSNVEAQENMITNLKEKKRLLKDRNVMNVNPKTGCLEVQERTLSEQSGGLFGDALAKQRQGAAVSDEVGEKMRDIVEEEGEMERWMQSRKPSTSSSSGGGPPAAAPGTARVSKFKQEAAAKKQNRHQQAATSSSSLSTSKANNSSQQRLASIDETRSNKNSATATPDELYEQGLRLFQTKKTDGNSSSSASLAELARLEALEEELLEAEDEEDAKNSENVKNNSVSGGGARSGLVVDDEEESKKETIGLGGNRAKPRLFQPNAVIERQVPKTTTSTTSSSFSSNSGTTAKDNKSFSTATSSLLSSSSHTATRTKINRSMYNSAVDKNSSDASSFALPINQLGSLVEHKKKTQTYDPQSLRTDLNAKNPLLEVNERLLPERFLLADDVKEDAEYEIVDAVEDPPTACEDERKNIKGNKNPERKLIEVVTESCSAPEGIEVPEREQQRPSPNNKNICTSSGTPAATGGGKKMSSVSFSSDLIIENEHEFSAANSATGGPPRGEGEDEPQAEQQPAARKKQSLFKSRMARQ